MITVAKIPFEQGTKKQQRLIAVMNDVTFTFTLNWNSNGFFTLNIGRGNKTILNQKLTDVSIMGYDPVYHMPLVCIYPFNTTVDYLDIRILSAKMAFDL